MQNGKNSLACGPTTLRLRLSTELNMPFTVKEIGLLMKKFEMDNGLVNIGEICITMHVYS